MSATPSTSQAVKRSDGLATAIEIARHLSDDKCGDVLLLDVRGISQVQDFVILATGTSDRQMRSAASGIKALLASMGSSVYRTSVDDQSTWVVIDCVDTVIHLFEPNTRSYYDLESMWGDARRIEWLRPGQKPFVIGGDEDVADQPAANSGDEDGETVEEIDLSAVVTEARSNTAKPKPQAKAAVTRKKSSSKATRASKPAAKPLKNVATKRKVAKKASPAKKAVSAASASKKKNVSSRSASKHTVKKKVVKKKR